MIEDKRITGALYDFLGWATSQEDVLKLGGSELVPPVVEALKKWAVLRGLSLDDADVKGWNTVDRAMDFSDALRALQSGQIVRNANWNGKGMYLTILNPPESVPAIYLCMPGDHPNYPHATVPWTPSQLDLMSEDWEVVK